MRDARRISAQEVSLGVQRHVLDEATGHDHGNGARKCGSTDFPAGGGSRRGAVPGWYSKCHHSLS
jgi:hypothetical protein